MTYEQLYFELNKLLPPDFHLQYGSRYREVFSLRLDGELICFEEPPERILWAVQHPEEYQAQLDTEVAEMLADLKGDE